jgi:hypothetical protein
MTKGAHGKRKYLRRNVKDTRLVFLSAFSNSPSLPAAAVGIAAVAAAAAAIPVSRGGV